MGVVIGPVEVKTQVEKDDKRKQFFSFKATATKNTETTWLLKIPGTVNFQNGAFVEIDTNDRILYGGQMWNENGVLGDSVTVDVVDHDNVLGQGIDYVLGSFSEDESAITVSPETITKKSGFLIHPIYGLFIDSPRGSRVYGGTWLRVRYVSTGTVDDVTFHATIYWDKVI